MNQKNRKLNEEEKSKLFVGGLKRIAKESLDNDEELLIRWWCNKYSLPPNHPLVLERHFEDLYVEFLQDKVIEEKQKTTSKLPEELENDVGWEDQIGEEHDEKIKRKLKNAPKVDLSKFVNKAKQIEEPEEFEDRY